MKVYLSLGSNLGNREDNILQAASLLSTRLGAARTRLSSLIQTRADGFSGPDFLNAALLLVLDTPVPPEQILDCCQEVEHALGRPAHGIERDSAGKRIYRSRTIDIDILLIDNQKINTPRLTVPHPAMYNREFVMIPLKEIIE